MVALPFSMQREGLAKQGGPCLIPHQCCGGMFVSGMTKRYGVQSDWWNDRGDPMAECATQEMSSSDGAELLTNAGTTRTIGRTVRAP